MTSPRIQDAEGRELARGDAVRRHSLWHGWIDGERFQGYGWRRGWVARTTGGIALPLAPSDRPNTYRCSHLLIDQDDKGGGEDA